MSCKYLILGNGFIGKKFNQRLDDSVMSDLIVKDKQSLFSEIEKFSPKIIINCIGKTGRPNIDWCEENKSETLFSNLIVPVMIAEVCKQTNRKMVHIGSGCIYEGDNNTKGFSEEDEPNYAKSFYSYTKVISERVLNDFHNILQVRIRMPIDSKPGPRNFITKILSYEKLINIENSVSILDDAIDATIALIKNKNTGIFNMVNKGGISHKEIIEMFEQISGKKINNEFISLDELHKMTKTKRSNCILSTQKLEKEGINIPHIKDSLKRCMEEYVKYL